MQLKTIVSCKGSFHGTWGFPMHGATPSRHPFQMGIFPYKPSMAMETPIIPYDYPILLVVILNHDSP